MINDNKDKLIHELVVISGQRYRAKQALPQFTVSPKKPEK